MAVKTIEELKREVKEMCEKQTLEFWYGVSYQVLHGITTLDRN